jgi:hypothetical protein
MQKHHQYGHKAGGKPPNLAPPPAFFPLVLHRLQFSKFTGLAQQWREPGLYLTRSID